MIKVNSTDLKNLLNTGWQSWSTKTIEKALFKLPTFNYSPIDINQTNLSEISIPKFLKKPVTGWCSWYAYGWDINETKILKQAEWISKNKQLPLKYILIDGGWCTWGDWLDEDNRRFPNGLKTTVKKIKDLGLSAGIWVAPFLIHPRSNVAKNNPNWLVRKNGKLVDGLKLTPWNLPMKFKRWILDIKNPEVQEYLSKAIEYLVHECGVELLKLDFLYGIYFNPNFEAKEADMHLRRFLLKIKDKYPQVYTIGCGCPLIPAVGAVDSMRIGPDSIVSPFLKFNSIVRIVDRYIFGYTIKTLESRIWTKDFWNVDLDSFVCRKLSGLSENQILKHRSLIKMSGGNTFLGDDLTKLPKKRLNKYIIPLFAK
ncbi:MAG TPA: glycoside hydrolase family 36 protein [Patescibacteria group bacterium]|nr:glycoside hydrolase family 36 protein [Patescibacteria group bacterium]